MQRTAVRVTGLGTFFLNLEVAGYQNHPLFRVGGSTNVGQEAVPTEGELAFTETATVESINVTC